MIITLNGIDYEFSGNSEMIVKYLNYEIELIESGFDEKSQKFEAGGVDSHLGLPGFIENRFFRFSELSVAKIFVDGKGNKKLTAYFD